MSSLQPPSIAADRLAVSRDSQFHGSGLSQHGESNESGLNPAGLDESLEAFKKVAEDYSGLMQSCGRHIGAWNQESMDVMAAKGLDFVRDKTGSLSRQLGYYTKAAVEEILPDQETQILWRILRDEKWKFPSDLFPKLSDQDIIEIYLNDHTQYFANSTFMVNCSYDLSYLNAYTWPELFERPAKYTQQISARIQQVLADPKMKTYDFNIEPHLGREKFSRQRKTLEINLGVICPLSDQTNQCIGYLTTFTPKQIVN